MDSVTLTKNIKQFSNINEIIKNIVKLIFNNLFKESHGLQPFAL